MPARIKLLTSDEFKKTLAELELLEKRVAELGNVLGPAYGAAWCDKALKIHRDLGKLRVQVEDRFHQPSQRLTVRQIMHND